MLFECPKQDISQIIVSIPQMHLSKGVQKNVHGISPPLLQPISLIFPNPMSR